VNLVPKKDTFRELAMSVFVDGEHWGEISTTDIAHWLFHEDFLMKLTHKFAELMPERRPQDPHLNGAGLRFETMEHGGEYPDAMPQAIKLTDAEGRSCIYVPITQDGKVVDSQRFAFDLEDD
jgi:hypothetical protein